MPGLTAKELEALQGAIDARRTVPRPELRPPAGSLPPLGENRTLGPSALGVPEAEGLPDLTISPERADAIAEGTGKVTRGALAVGLGFTPGGIAARVGAQVGGNLGLETYSRMKNGASFSEALTTSMPEAGLMGLAELGVEGVSAKGAAALRLVRDGAKATARGIKRTFRAGNAEPGVALSTHADEFVAGGRAAVARAERMIDPATGEAAMITPGRVLDDTLASRAESMAEAGFLGGRIRRVRRKTSAMAHREIQDVVDSFPNLSREETMGLVQMITRNSNYRMKGVAQAHFNRVDELMSDNTIFFATPGGIFTKGAPVDIRGSKALAKRIIQEQGEGIASVDPRLVRLAEGKDDFVSFSEAQRIRSDLFDISGQLDLGASATLKRDKAAAKRLVGSMSSDMNKAFKLIPNGDEAAQLYKTANRIWGQETQGIYTQQFVKKLATDDPANMLDAILTADPGDIRIIRKVLAKADGAEVGGTWRHLQGHFIGRLLKDATSDAGTAAVGTASSTGLRLMGDDVVIDGARLFNNIGDAQYQQLVQEFFPGQSAAVIDNLKEIANVLRVNAGAAARTQGTDMGIAIKLMQTSAVIGAGTAAATGNLDSDVAAGAGLFMAAPWMMARALTDRRMMRAFTLGATHPPGSRTAARAMLVWGGMTLADYGEEMAPQAKAWVAEQVEDAKKQLGITRSGFDVRFTERERQQLPPAFAPGTDNLLADEARRK